MSFVQIVWLFSSICFLSHHYPQAMIYLSTHHHKWILPYSSVVLMSPSQQTLFGLTWLAVDINRVHTTKKALIRLKTFTNKPGATCMSCRSSPADRLEPTIRYILHMNSTFLKWFGDSIYPACLHFYKLMWCLYLYSYSIYILIYVVTCNMR